MGDWNQFFEVRESGIDRNMQYIGGAVAILAHLTLGFSVLSEQVIKFFSSVKGRLLGGFCVLALALAPLSIDPLRTALYAVSTLGVFLVASWAWLSDYARFRRVLFVAGVVLLAFLAALIVHHGMSRTSVGGIQRNRYAQTALAGMLCLFLARGWTKWLGFAVAMAMSLLVTSRGTIVAFGVFAVVYFALKYGMARGILTTLCLAVGGVFFLALPKIGDRASDALVNRVAKVNDAERGFGTGFTGRLDTWEQGLRVFSRSPAIGHGFRTRVGAVGGEGNDYVAHSGYVNMLADVGIIGSALIMAALLYDFFKRFGVIQSIKRQHLRNSPEMIDTYELNCTICAVMAAEAFLWLFEPLYLNLGATRSIMFILLFMAPYAVGRVALAWPYGYAPSSMPR
jgi:hypothetical protein